LAKGKSPVVVSSLAPRAWLSQLEYYFGEMKLPSITVGEIKKFAIWLSKIPARSRIVEDENGELVLNIKEDGGHQYGDHPSGLVFGGIKKVKRSFNTACRLTGIEGLHKHDLRHAFVTRSILRGRDSYYGERVAVHIHDLSP
jgi:integrase